MTYHWLTRVTRQVSPVEQELFTFLYIPGFRGIPAAHSLFFCVVFCTLLFVLLTFIFWSLYCVFLQFTASDYPFGIFKFFLYLEKLIL
jgi:hypothetical protein